MKKKSKKIELLEKRLQILRKAINFLRQKSSILPKIKSKTTIGAKSPNVTVGNENGIANDFVPSIKAKVSVNTKIKGMTPKSNKDPSKVAAQIKDPNKKKQAIANIKAVSASGKLFKSEDSTVPFNPSGTNLHDVYNKSVNQAYSNLNQNPLANKFKISGDTINLDKIGSINHKKHENKTSFSDPNISKSIHDIDLSNRRMLGDPKNRTTATKDTFVAKNKAGDQFILKNANSYGNVMDRMLRGHYDNNNFNAAKREALYHDLGKHVFGLEDRVPDTTSVKLNGEDYSVQKWHKNGMRPYIDIDKDHRLLIGDEYQKALTNEHKSGMLHKMVLADAIMGNNDRHRENYLIDPKDNKIKLIDNANSFDYQNLGSHTPKFLGDLEVLNTKNWHEGKESHKPNNIHPEAINTIKNLDMDKAKEIFKAHGIDENSDVYKGFVDRVNKAKEQFAEREYKGVKTHKYLNPDSLWHEIKQSTNPEKKPWHEDDFSISSHLANKYGVDKKHLVDLYNKEEALNTLKNERQDSLGDKK